jgi:hypothetical protein
MDRNTDLANMDAPPVGSGKDANETILKGTASTTPSEKGSNVLEEYVTPAQPKSNLGGQAKH